VIVLNKQDLTNAATEKEIIQAVEDAVKLYETDKYLMPDRMHIDTQNNTLLLMPSFVPGRFGTKLVSVFPCNREKNKPVVIGTMILNDGQTGEPLAILDGTELTALRTGAVGAVGIKYLAPPALDRLGIVGAGVQGYRQALFSSYVRELSKLYVFDPDHRKSEELIRQVKRRRPGLECQIAANVRELLESCGAVIVATTSSKPVLPEDPAVLEGKCFIGIGSFRPHMREFPRAFFPLVKRVVVDTRHAKEETGDLVFPLQQGLIPQSQVITMGQYIAGGFQPEVGETTFFKSVGMALFDIVTADLIYRKAVEKGLGQPIKF